MGRQAGRQTRRKIYTKYTFTVGGLSTVARKVRFVMIIGRS